MIRLLIIFVLILLMTITSLFPKMVFDIQIDDFGMRNSQFDSSMPILKNIGEPMVPFKDLRILLPQGKVFQEAGIDIKRDKYVSVPQINHTQEPLPISYFHDVNSNYRITRNETIYQRDAYYPYKDIEILGIERKNGHDILILNIYPYQYNPVKETVKWASDITLTIKTESCDGVAYQQNLFLVQNERIRDEISHLVINPEILNTYYKQPFRRESLLADPNNPFEMIVISEKSKEEVFEDFIDWKFDKGITTGFFTTEDIYNTYKGVDNQEKIRNFIIDAYKTYSLTKTPLEYVILGGDDQIIPIRGLYGRVGQYVDYNMPADIYYSNLDGCWDGNGNGIYGELNDDIDYFSEVAIGRIPAYSNQEFYNFFEKTYRYVDVNSFSNDIVYMLGENLDNTPTWGGDYKDEIIPYIPDDYHMETLYERDETFSSQGVYNIFEGGFSYINHIGHANHSTVFGIRNSRVSSLNNTEFGFAYTQGCHPAAFDYGTSEESGAVGQNLTIASGGLFAFIGNTRYGWYRRGTTDGPSQAFDITFFEGLYDKSIRELGHTMNYSKESLVNQAKKYDVMRWVYFQLILFGDPSVAVKDPLGTFPFVEVSDFMFDDVKGDGDGVVNPGETINIYVEINNLENWADATETVGTLYIDDHHIQILNETVYFGDIPTNDSINNEDAPFMVALDDKISYGTYELNLLIESLGVDNAKFSKVYSIPMPVTLEQKKWPWRHQYPINANPVFADLNNDGVGEIVVTDVQGNVNFLDREASFSRKQIENTELLWRSSSLGDLTGNGKLDIVMASRRNKVIAYSVENDTLFTYNDCGQIVLTPVIADINNDGNNQIVVLDIDKKLYVIDNEGKIGDGFPLTLSQTAVADLAVADLTGDGNQEIVVGTLDGKLHAVKYDASFVDGFPVQLDSRPISAPIILPNYDIVVSTGGNKLHLISKEGKVLMERKTQGRVAMEIIAADFTNDNILEFAYVTNNGYIDIINRQGSSLSGFPIRASGSFLHPPLAVDMNGDNLVNLIAHTSTGTIYAFNHQGEIINYFPYPVGRSIEAPASIADIDKDGDLDIIISTSSGVTVIDYKNRYKSIKPWTTYRANLQRTGFYGEDHTLEIEEINVPIVTNLKQNYPNPFNPETKIDFALSKNSHILLEVFNLKGQRINTLIDEYLKEGHHSVVWQGVDNKQNIVSSGIYFYRLTTENKLFHKKMMLLK